MLCKVFSKPFALNSTEQQAPGRGRHCVTSSSEKANGNGHCSGKFRRRLFHDIGFCLLRCLHQASQCLSATTTNKLAPAANKWASTITGVSDLWTDPSFPPSSLSRVNCLRWKINSGFASRMANPHCVCVTDPSHEPVLAVRAQARMSRLTRISTVELA